MTRRFYSNGKLLLAGEYVILDGALGLAVPTKFGQSLQASSIHSPQLRWTSLDEKGEIWFESSFTLEHYEPIESSDRETADTLSRILCAAKKGNPRFLETGHQVETRLGFSRNWGLGSSSTLINNIAQWAEIDAHELLWNSFSGSGYDISCAQHSHPIFYQLKKRAPIVAKATFDPTFKKHLYFVHLNEKRNSRDAIKAYQSRTFNKEGIIQKISEITRNMPNAMTITEFDSLLEQHEELLSVILGIKPIKASLFVDYFGAIKSLGAWGGDFILATGNEKTPGYFRSKGFETILSYDEMVL